MAAAPVPLSSSADSASHLVPPDERRAYVADRPMPLRAARPETERASGSDYFVIPRSVLERWRRAEA